MIFTAEVLQIIVTACHIGAAGMGGNYSYESTIMEHHHRMVDYTMKTQRDCQRQLIKCAEKKALEKCLSE